MFGCMAKMFLFDGFLKSCLLISSVSWSKSKEEKKIFFQTDAIKACRIWFWGVACLAQTGKNF